MGRKIDPIFLARLPTRSLLFAQIASAGLIPLPQSASGQGQPPSISAEEALWTKLAAEADKMLKAKNDQGALVAYAAAIEAGRKSLVTNPEDIFYKGELAYTLYRHGLLLALDDANKDKELAESVALERDVYRDRPGNLKVENLLLNMLTGLADSKFNRKEYNLCLEQYYEALKIISTSPGSAARDLRLYRASILKMISNANYNLKDYVGASNASKARIVVLREMFHPRNDGTQARLSFASSLSSAAFEALLAKNYIGARDLANEAITLEPRQIWMYTNVAHALMMTGQVNQARKIYLEFRGELANGKARWNETVLQDFGLMRAAGVSNPLMEEVAGSFSPPNH